MAVSGRAERARKRALIELLDQVCVDRGLVRVLLPHRLTVDQRRGPIGRSGSSAAQVRQDGVGDPILLLARVPSGRNRYHSVVAERTCCPARDFGERHQAEQSPRRECGQDYEPDASEDRPNPVASRVVEGHTP
jgi:hypothetical protein